MTPGANTKVYGAVDPALTGSLSGFLVGDGVTAVYSRTAGETVLGGPYTISAVLSPVGVLSNYTITYNTALFTITPKALTIKANALTKIFGATYVFDTTPPSPDFTVTGLIGSDSVTSVVLTSPGAAAGASVAGNPFAVTISGALGTGLDNYAVTYMNGTLSLAYIFVGFTSPVDNNEILNVVKAGQAIPLKWRVLDAANQPVSNLTSVNVYVSSLSCSLGLTTDQLTEVASGASGLQNLGNGYYQFNWKSPTSYARSCKTLHVDLGDGVSRTALFQFTK